MSVKVFDVKRSAEMNAKKGKGKRPNKTPNPQQKEEIDVEKVENVTEEFESAQKVEERVPEIISEIVPPPAESKEKEEDSPKKPKRNRGKKKKGDKDEGENQDQPAEPTESLQLEIVEIDPQETVVEENVTPSARKKKNKNKKSSDSESKLPEKSDAAPIEEVISEIDSAMKEESKSQDVGDQETKTTKKKNKKKKRTDSERSDSKNDEISCVSAFQKLLKDEKVDNKVTENEPIPQDVKIPEIPKSGEMNISAFIQELEKVEDTDFVSQEMKTSGKSKKKNKKDKKEPFKEVEPDMITEISLMTAIKPITKKEEPTFEKQQVETMQSTDMEKTEEDIKSKAKIAKPVERKRKGKQDKHVEELATETFDLEPTTENKELIQEYQKIGTGLATDVIQCEIAAKPEELMLPEPVVEEIKEAVPKPSEKKKKGKGNKHGGESEAEIIPVKEGTIKEEKVPIQETMVDTILSFNKNTNITKDDKLTVTTEAEENKQETQSESRSDKKRKGKKDAKKQEPLTEIIPDVKDSKITETKPEVMSENIFALTDIPTVGKTSKAEDKVENKLIKPDEVKNIDKQQTPNLETSKVTVSTPIKEPVLNIPAQEILQDIPFLHDPIENIQAKQETATDIDIVLPVSEPDQLKETSFITTPESGMGKKRKKSPKPSKHDLKSKITEAQADFVPEETIPGIEQKLLLDKKEPTLEITQEQVILPEQEEKNKETEMFVTNEPIVLESLLETDDKTSFETKSKKKRKKSPKLPKDPESVQIESGDNVAIKDTKQEKSNIASPTLLSAVAKSDSGIIADKSSEVKQESGNKGQGFTDLSSDLEIRSLKADESEGSTCGFTPDIIQHPMATSQHFVIDNNNNTLIQEINTAEEAKLQIPIQIPDTPFIQGSGATPLETPENILVGIKISQTDTTKIEPEKTDLKSKMMEVNQDMEELRLSIERSLAELTAIEKKEDEVEKQFEDKKVTSGDIPPTEVKISMPSEIVAKTQSQPEKTEAPKEKSGKSRKEKAQVIKATPEMEPNPETINVLVSPPYPIEAIIPPKTSMFFDKELKDAEEQVKPDIVQQGNIPVSEVLKSPELVSDVISLPSVVSATNIEKPFETLTDTPPVPPLRKSASKERENKEAKLKMTPEKKPVEPIPAAEIPKLAEVSSDTTPPVCPTRKDQKNKGKNKKKGKQESTQAVAQTGSSSASTEGKDQPQEKKEEMTGQKSQSTPEKGKQQSDTTHDSDMTSKKDKSKNAASEFEPIENFEDAMTSSADDINKTFEMIANEASRSIEASNVNPEIKIVAPAEEVKKDKKSKRDEKANPLSQPKNLLGHPDIPARLNKTDYKKEKNKTPNAILAKVKIKDSVEIEANKQTKDTQTDNIKKFMNSKSIDESFSSVTNENDEFIYKYSFRKVFLQSACHVCKKDLKQGRVPCSFCNLVFYCNMKHKDEDWPQHQGLCFAVSTIVHLKEQKHIYADAQNITGQDYRLLRMQMIVSLERVLKRTLVPWEQEALLYPRICADVGCREWRQSKLADCEGCGQISYCSNNPSHLPKTHQRWCKSYALYQKLVCHQQTKGRLEPPLPGKVMMEPYKIPDKINEALATMYEEKIDMNDIQYAALTQIATAPLTAAYCHQTYSATSHANGTYKKTSCTIHVVGGELQFEADALNKWELFFLHLRPLVAELTVVMVGADLNPSRLPLQLLKTVKLCETCRLKKRRVVFSFQDKTTYHEYRNSEEFITPDLVCAFNPGIHRSALYGHRDPWPKTVAGVMRMRTPFLLTAHTVSELHRDLAKVREWADVDVKVLIEPGLNGFASARPDRNFVSDDEAPLLLRSCASALVCGAR